MREATFLDSTEAFRNPEVVMTFLHMVFYLSGDVSAHLARQELAGRLVRLKLAKNAQKAQQFLFDCAAAESADSLPEDFVAKCAAAQENREMRAPSSKDKASAKKFIASCKDLPEPVDLQGVIDSMTECQDAADYIWTRPTVVMRYLSSTVKREESMNLFKKKAITNLEPCKRCGSKDIRYAMKQIRALDEGQSVLIQCANCNLSNRVA